MSKNSYALKIKEQKNKSTSSLKNYSIEDSIGEGTFGLVKIASHLQTGEKVAIKILEKSKIKDKSHKERVLREMNFLKKLNHDNIIQLYEIIEQEDNIYLVMEYARQGEFFNYIVEKTRLNENEASLFFVQIINALEYIHKNKISHRDLKPENLLLTHNKVLKCIDFGLSNSIKEGNSLSTPCGSPCYAAPEMLQGKKYNGERTDIWSTGIILYAMVCGYLPFEDEVNSELYKKIIECKLEFIIPLSEDCLDLIHKILNTNPEKRITIPEIKKHNFFKVGERLLKDIRIKIDDKKISEEVLKMMSLLGFNVDEVKTDIAKKAFNNNTTTFSLLSDKLKYENFIKKENEIANCESIDFEQSIDVEIEDNSLIKGNIEEQILKNEKEISILKESNAFQVKNTDQSEFNNNLNSLEEYEPKKTVEDEDVRLKSKEMEIIYLPPQTQQLRIKNKKEISLKNNLIEKKYAQSRLTNNNTSCNKVIKLSNYIAQNSNYKNKILQKNNLTDHSQEKSMAKPLTNREITNKTNLGIMKFIKKTMAERYLTTDTNYEYKNEKRYNSNSFNNKSFDSSKYVNKLHRKVFSNPKAKNELNERDKSHKEEMMFKKVHPFTTKNKISQQIPKNEKYDQKKLINTFNKFYRSNETPKIKQTPKNILNFSKKDLIFSNKCDILPHQKNMISKVSIESKGFSELMKKVKRSNLNNHKLSETPKDADKNIRKFKSTSIEGMKNIYNSNENPVKFEKKYNLKIKTDNQLTGFNSNQAKKY